MNKEFSLIIVGAGGAGVEALWVTRRINQSLTQSSWKILGYADDNLKLQGELIDGVLVLGTAVQVVEKFYGQRAFFHAAIGNNRNRQRLAEFFEKQGFTAATLVDPEALISPSAEIGAGCYVAPFVFIGPNARLGRHVLVNVGASVGHYSMTGDWAQICPGARIAGGAELGQGAFIGSNAVVTPGVKIGNWATVAANSLAARDLPEGVTGIGIPARIVAPSVGTQPSDV